MHTIAIFTGGDVPPEGAIRAILSPCDFIITADMGLMAAHALGYRVDEAIGDFDSLKDMSLLDGVKVVKRYPCDKDYTDTELALMEARKIDSTAKVLLIGGDGGRIDHTIAVFDSFRQSYHADIWVTSLETAYYMKEHDNIIIEGAYEEPISVLNLGDNTQAAISTQGLVWSGDKFNYTDSIVSSLSNRASGEHTPVKIEVLYGKYMLCLPHGAIVKYSDK